MNFRVGRYSCSCAGAQTTGMPKSLPNWTARRKHGIWVTCRTFRCDSPAEAGIKKGGSPRIRTCSNWQRCSANVLMGHVWTGLIISPTDVQGGLGEFLLQHVLPFPPSPEKLYTHWHVALNNTRDHLQIGFLSFTPSPTVAVTVLQYSVRTSR